MGKNKLLTIGEVANLMCISIHSLRYYERIGILKPIVIDPNTGYRYYAFEQLFHIQMITFCVELGIPLKELAEFMDDDKTIDYLALLAYGKKIAKEKLQKIQKVSQFIDRAEKQILESSKSGAEGAIYSRNLPEKYFHIVAYDKPFKGDNLFEEVAKAFLHFEVDDNEDYDDFILESGLLCEYSQSGIERYIYIELAKPIEDENVKVIPSGSYYCVQNRKIAIEDAKQIFSDYLIDTNSYLAIETAFFAGAYNIDKPVSELRIIPQDNQAAPNTKVCTSF